jgi:hypothetical protein
MSKINEKSTIVKKREYKQKGITLRTNAKSKRTIITANGLVNFLRYSLYGKTDLDREKLAALGKGDSIVPLDNFF